MKINAAGTPRGIMRVKNLVLVMSSAVAMSFGYVRHAILLAYPAALRLLSLAV